MTRYPHRIGVRTDRAAPTHEGTVGAVQISGAAVVVTGAAGGIGRALARGFHERGAASVVIADLDEAGAIAVADELNAIRPASALGLGADVGSEAGNVALIDAARAAFGRIDLFFANAGIGVGTDPLVTTEEEWDLIFRVNTHSHRWAAKHLLPEWLERGSGYFASTASAAGVLTQIGSAPYAVTKHAALAFAEWMAVTYGDLGIGVTCLCPMGVNTNLLNPPTAGGGIDSTAGDVVRAAGNVLEPEEAAAVTLDTIEAGRFLSLPHPEVATFFQRKAADHDRWIAGMQRLQARVRSAG